MSKELKAIAFGLVLTIFILISIGPIFTIWSLNTIFGLNIPLNFYTWVSMAWLLLILNQRSVNKNSSSL
jgi:hypothetical protein